MEDTALQERFPMGLGGLVMGREWEGELGSSSDMGTIVWRQQGGATTRMKALQIAST